MSTQYVLSISFSCHCLVVLKNTMVDWGPKTFKILNCLFFEEGFMSLIDKH